MNKATLWNANQLQFIVILKLPSFLAPERIRLAWHLLGDLSPPTFSHPMFIHLSFPPTGIHCLPRKGWNSADDDEQQEWEVSDEMGDKQKSLLPPSCSHQVGRQRSFQRLDRGQKSAPTDITTQLYTTFPPTTSLPLKLKQSSAPVEIVFDRLILACSFNYYNFSAPDSVTKN